MAHVNQHRDVSGNGVKDVYDRTPTEGDAIRFFSAENGHKEIVHTGDTSLVDSGLNRVVVESGSHLFNLDFEYIVSANQLHVWVPQDTSTPLFLQVPSINEKNVAETASGFPGTPFDFDIYYEEVGSSSVRVYGLTVGTGVVMFSVPHTAIPADSRNKIIVQDQGDNRAVEFLGFGDGVLFRSPDGRRWLQRIDNSGTPVIEPR